MSIICGVQIVFLTMLISLHTGIIYQTGHRDLKMPDIRWMSNICGVQIVSLTMLIRLSIGFIVILQILHLPEIQS